MNKNVDASMVQLIRLIEKVSQTEQTTVNHCPQTGVQNLNLSNLWEGKNWEGTHIIFLKKNVRNHLYLIEANIYT